MNLNANRTAKFLAACLLTFNAIAPSWAAGEVTIAPVFTTPAVEEKVAVPAGRVYVTDIGNLREGSRALVQIASENKAFPDITALVMEKAAVQAYLAGQRVAASGFERKAPPLNVQFISPREAEYVLVLDNRYSMLMTKQVRTKVVVAQKLNPTESQAMQAAISTVTARVRARYEVPAFDVMVKPCGFVNASSRFSDGAITLCTEMIAKTGTLPGALVGIVYHEIGHSLLSLWGLPGHNNEDTADEFAVQLALRTPNEAKDVYQFANFFESRDPWMEARNMIEQGDRHSLGVQRARNIRAALKAPKELTDRWNELTYPRMTTEALTAIAQNPGQFESATLASKVLSGRQAIAGAGATKLEPSPLSDVQLAAAPPFEKYPAKVIDGAMPAGQHQKVNYGGRYSIAVNSCGTGCRYYTMRDMATGQDLNWLARFAAAEPRPRTKDGYEYISMLYSKPDSSLLVAQFEVSMPSGKTECWEQFFVPNGGSMKATGPVAKSCSRVE